MLRFSYNHSGFEAFGFVGAQTGFQVYVTVRTQNKRRKELIMLPSDSGSLVDYNYPECEGLHPAWDPTRLWTV